MIEKLLNFECERGRIKALVPYIKT